MITSRMKKFGMASGVLATSLAAVYSQLSEGNKNLVKTTVKLGGITPFLFSIVQAQKLTYPFTKDVNRASKSFHGLLRKALDYKVTVKDLRGEFNNLAGKDKRPVIIASNHLSDLDPVVLSGNVDGVFAGKADILKWPFVGDIARAAKYIPLKRPKYGEAQENIDFYNKEARGGFIEALNRGDNVIFFPEATTGNGELVHLMRFALFTILFGDKGLDIDGNEVQLKRDVLVQPVAIKLSNKEHKRIYMLDLDKKNISEILKSGKIEIELIKLPLIDPNDYLKGLDRSKLTEDNIKDLAKKIANDIALSIASEFNPGQTEFPKNVIPSRRKPAEPSAS